jgi:hypothetical protein
MSQEEKKNDWKLEKIELEFNTYGENKGKYTGRVMFTNGDWESFRFKILPDMAKPYLALISKDVVRSADSLARRLCESLGITDQLQTKPVEFKTEAPVSAEESIKLITGKNT